MEENKSLMELLFQKVQNYFSTSIELYQLKLMSKSVDILTKIISYFILFLILFITILMLSIGCAYWIGDLLGKVYYGFLMVGLCYTIIGLLIYVYRHRCIHHSVKRKLTTQFLNNKSND